ncbi:MAG: hypothetical protein IKS45_00525, partial [Thermoguttaceae bacterium]|nr:hypothetical protein [Thermoguttaceae bacterium]
MSQQTTQSQPIMDNSAFQECKPNAKSQNKEENLSRSLYSLLHPGNIDWYVLREFLYLFVVSSL